MPLLWRITDDLIEMDYDFWWTRYMDPVVMEFVTTLKWLEIYEHFPLADHSNNWTTRPDSSSIRALSDSARMDEEYMSWYLRRLSTDMVLKYGDYYISQRPVISALHEMLMITYCLDLQSV